MEKSKYESWSIRDLLDTASRTGRTDDDRGNIFLDEHGEPIPTPPAATALQETGD